MDSIPNFSKQLAHYYYKLDRDILQAMTKQIWEEARHYDLLASLLEKKLGRKIKPSEIKPLPQTLAQNSAMSDYGMEDIVTMFASKGNQAFT